MNWARMDLDGALRLALLALRSGLLALTLVLTACATGPGPEGKGDEAARAEARAQLTQSFATAIVLEKDGKLDEAKARFQNLADNHPELTGPVANLALIAMKEGDTARAETLFKVVIEHKPTQVQALNALGVLSRRKGEFEQAERYYRSALAADPDYAPALRNLAILLELYRGRFEDALALVKHYQALQAEPDRATKDWIFDLNSRIQARAGES